ncbi:23S rRNA (guanosine(2251)-2'-O)-methyltransferase RlmB [Mycoplasma sp. 1018B]|uniref:23S rRNA (guanosine(2251)-2'-O)-methyltransferase RlmB n=1 Tax=Mycoplasma sp. 1018B TaxID=2967302 RepID=UPI00211CB3EF|nr:23S rRNA (guanosine(2251)-2'-O)-methyltransferase RlmB [Mycoplasma sp. 1018B]UUM19326.1 23S rRNA (guanosine(2251)-2'-O)-methyltransferase RlmB [Mycoplasma sp. 1018B]
MEKLILCGRNSVFDAIDNNFQIEKIFISYENIKLLQKLSHTKIKIEKKSKQFLDNMTKENHQGIIAILKFFPIYDINTFFNDKPSNILILDHIQDPHNLGAIIRTANAFGIKHIIIPKDRSADITATVLKISSGGFIDIKIAKVANISAVIKKLKEHNYWIFATALSEKAITLEKVKFNEKNVLIVGNEEKGISLPVLKMSDQVIYIKQFGKVQSLNVSVATGILLYELTKENNC